MAFTPFDFDVEIHSKLGDDPNIDNDLTAEQIKALFDSPMVAFKSFINDILIPALNSFSPESSTAVFISQEKPTYSPALWFKPLPNGNSEMTYIGDGGAEYSLKVQTNVTAESLPEGAITENVLADGAVSTAKLADNSVTDAKIRNGAVTIQKIADRAVTKDKLDRVYVEIKNSKADPNATTSAVMALIPGTVTITQEHNGKTLVAESSGSGDFVFLLPNGLPIGFECEIIRATDGAVRFEGYGANVSSAGGGTAIADKWGIVGAKLISADRWILAGGLE